MFGAEVSSWKRLGGFPGVFWGEERDEGGRRYVSGEAKIAGWEESHLHCDVILSSDLLSK